MLLRSRVLDIQTNQLNSRELNQHYSSTSTDPEYTPPLLKQTADEQATVIDEPTLLYILEHLHHTADGSDSIPAWFLRLTAVANVTVLAHLLNKSFTTSHVPT